MQYIGFQTQEDLHELLQNNRVISGRFLCNFDSQAFYDVDCSDKIFKNCIIVKGDFVGTNFTRCIFDNVVFRETLFTTVFENCEFIDCIFSNTDSHFTFENTKIVHFSQCSEEESIMEDRIQQMLKKASENTYTLIQDLRSEGETAWEHVWKNWCKREGTREDWQKVAQQKGWGSWEEWRDAWVSNFGAQKRQWFRYIIPDPLRLVPGFRVGPTQAWQENFPEGERNRRTFRSLIGKRNYEKNEKVQGILEKFPVPTELIGIVLSDQSIVLIEGHHRATALALTSKVGKTMVFDELPTIALTFFEVGEEKLLDTILAKGSRREAYGYF